MTRQYIMVGREKLLTSWQQGNKEEKETGRAQGPNSPFKGMPSIT
jgi:hypothetical protein